jgi:hypothetical protein
MLNRLDIGLAGQSLALIQAKTAGDMTNFKTLLDKTFVTELQTTGTHWVKNGFVSPYGPF